jgi:predicted DNA-binding protein with PD1-like motif
MKHLKMRTGFMIRLDGGEEIIESLVSFCRREKVKGARFQGLGTCRGPALGFYHFDRQSYEFREFPGDFEITSLTGNVSWGSEGPMVHAHVVLSGSDFIVLGGHLKAARVLATCEIALDAFPRALTRKRDAATGLNLLTWGGPKPARGRK